MSLLRRLHCVNLACALVAVALATAAWGDDARKDKDAEPAPAAGGGSDAAKSKKEKDEFPDLQLEQQTGKADSKAPAKEEPNEQPKSGGTSSHGAKVDPSSPDYQSGGVQNKVEGPERDDLLASVEKDLDAQKPVTGKKADDDFFVIGTVDLQKHHATVDYLIKKGLHKTAEFVADFMLNKPVAALRQWQAFGRAKTMKNAEGLRKKAKAQGIEDRLLAFKLNTNGKKSPVDDYFVAGTADLDTITEHADIRFEILKGVKKTTDFLLDFILNRPKEHKGDWHVFFRGKTEAEAIAYRQKLRDWYDTMESQRARIAEIYNAKTTARC
jgi:hypothetical protein